MKHGKNEASVIYQRAPPYGRSKYTTHTWNSLHPGNGGGFDDCGCKNSDHRSWLSRRLGTADTAKPPNGNVRSALDQFIGGAMKELPYSDNDIVALYRGARHPLRQIGIIAQLCDCSAAEIAAVLRKKGEPLPKKWHKSGRTTNTYTRRQWTDEEDAIIIDMYRPEVRTNYTVLSEALGGVSRSKIKTRIDRLKLIGKIPGKEKSNENI